MATRKKKTRRRAVTSTGKRWDDLWRAYIAALNRGDNAAAEKAKRSMRAFDKANRFAPMAFYRK